MSRPVLVVLACVLLTCGACGGSSGGRANDDASPGQLDASATERAMRELVLALLA